jgi:hypothetical protein
VASLPISQTNENTLALLGQWVLRNAGGVLMRVLGLDVGIAPIGWALIEIEDAGEEEPGAQGKILAAGVWKFDPPEEKSSKRLQAQIRDTEEFQEAAPRAASSPPAHE